MLKLRLHPKFFGPQLAKHFVQKYVKKSFVTSASDPQSTAIDTLNLISEQNIKNCLEGFTGSAKFEGKAFQKSISTKSNASSSLRKPKTLSQAAVLIPFCLNQEQRPSVLFTLRSAQLASHKYEVCFPGGKLCPFQDNNDLMATAVRETVEEIGISDDSIQVIGKLPAFPTKQSIVHPVLARLDLNCRPETFKLSDEVEEVLLSPLDKLLDGRHWFHTHWQEGYSTPLFKDDMFDDRQRPRIWGLTAFFLHLVLQNLAKNQFKVKYPTIVRYE